MGVVGQVRPDADCRSGAPRGRPVMEETMADRAKSLVIENAPWRADANPLIVVLQGIALLAVGLFMLFMPDTAKDVTRWLIGLVLLIMSLQQIGQAFRMPRHAFTPFQMLRGGIGATVGVLVTIEPIFPSFSSQAAWIVLGLGMLAVGAIGLAGVLFSRSAEGVQIEAIITSALTIAFGFVLLFSKGSSGGTPMLGIVSAIGGAGLLIYGLMMLRSRGNR
jgi:uncharacterized membrane protein HdeD (DUF308 family)